jgi:hypothetical protein
MKRFTRLALTVALFAAALPTAQAVGNLADITVVDRETRQVLPVTWHQGSYYIAGRPGARYAISVRNQSGARLMAVMSVDGVNIVSGETAGWSQNGYVFDGYQSGEISGWRKSDSHVAAFQFTALSNSYAARTGRPNQVGVIGVALFRERDAEPPVSVNPPCRKWWPCDRERDTTDSAQPRSKSQQDNGDTRAARKDAAPPAEGMASASPPMRREAESLGTGHGRSETSVVSRTTFERASSAPAEVISIRYDSRENLIAQGVLPPDSVAWHRPQPRPFPATDNGYVPDPPGRW